MKKAKFLGIGLVVFLTSLYLVVLPVSAELVQVEVNVALGKAVVASSTYNSTYVASGAVDGISNSDSSNRWLSAPGINSVHTETLDIDLGETYTLHKATVHTGMVNGGNAARSIVLSYWNGSAYVNIPGASVTSNNTVADLTFVFTSSVTTNKVRASFNLVASSTDSAMSLVRVRELKIFSYQMQDITIPRVFNLQANSVTHETVSLTWTAPAEAIQGYSIQRNEVEIAQINNTQTSFNDYGLWPTTQLTYSIKTIMTDGTVNSIGVDIIVNTLAAPAYKKGYNTNLLTLYDDKPSYYAYGAWGGLLQSDDAVKHRFDGKACKLAFTTNDNAGVKMLIYNGPKDIQTAVNDKKAAISLWVLATQLGDFQGSILTQGGDAWRFRINSYLTASDLYKWKHILIPIPATESGKNYVWSKITDVTFEGTNNLGKTLWIDNMMVVSMSAPVISGAPAIKDTNGNLVSSDMNYVDGSAKTIALQFNAEYSRMDTATLTESNIKVQTSGGTEVLPYTWEYDSVQGIYNISLVNTLHYATQYEIALSGVKNINGAVLDQVTGFKTSPSFRVVSKKMVDGADKTIDVSKPLTQVKANVVVRNGLSDPKSATSYLALYHNGNLVKVSLGTATEVTNSSGDITINAEIDNLENILLSDGYSIVLYTWESQSLRPMISKFPLQ